MTKIDGLTRLAMNAKAAKANPTLCDICGSKRTKKHEKQNRDHVIGSKERKFMEELLGSAEELQRMIHERTTN